MKLQEKMQLINKTIEERRTGNFVDVDLFKGQYPEMSKELCHIACCEEVPENLDIKQFFNNCFRFYLFIHPKMVNEETFEKEMNCINEEYKRLRNMYSSDFEIKMLLAMTSEAVLC